MEEWRRTMRYIYLYHTPWILFSHESKGNPGICNNTDGPWGHDARWHSQAEKDKCCMTLLICGIWISWNRRNREWNGSDQGLGRYLSGAQSFCDARRPSPGDMLCSTVSGTEHSMLCTECLWKGRSCIKHSDHTHKRIMMKQQQQ